MLEWLIFGGVALYLVTRPQTDPSYMIVPGSNIVPGSVLSPTPLIPSAQRFPPPSAVVLPGVGVSQTGTRATDTYVAPPPDVVGQAGMAVATGILAMTPLSPVLGVAKIIDSAVSADTNADYAAIDRAIVTGKPVYLPTTGELFVPPQAIDPNSAFATLANTTIERHSTTPIYPGRALE